MKKVVSSRPTHLCSRLIALAITGSLFAGCAHMQQPGEFSKAELKLSQYAAMTSAEAVQKFEQSYESPSKDELAMFAPEHYSTAGKALSEAKSLISQNGPRDQIVQKVAVGEAVLRNANRVATKVKETLSDELEIKNKLESLNTQEVYSAEYGSLVDRLNKVIENIETGKTPEAQDRQKLIQDMQRLEQKARRYNAMHEPEEILKRVKYRGGEKLAPITYAEALEVFKKADEFIKQNPTYEVGIEKIGQEALFAAKRALYITEQVAALSQKFELSPEQIILDEEYRLHRVARELTDKDLRDHPLEVQSEMLAKAAVEHEAELKNKEELVFALRDTLIKVRDSSNRLTSLSERAKDLKAEKSEWLAKEALYKAKLRELKEDLNSSIVQLDSTQQKVLEMKNQNTLLSQKLATSQQQLAALNAQLETDRQEMLSQPETASPANVAESEPAPENLAQDNAKTTDVAESQNTTADAPQQAETQPASAPDEAKVDVATTENNESVSREETLKALESAKELIQLLQAKDDSEAKPVSPVNLKNQDDVFVDASE